MQGVTEFLFHSLLASLLTAIHFHSCLSALLLRWVTRLLGNGTAALQVHMPTKEKNDKRRRKVRRGGGVKPGGRPGRGHQQGCETMRCIKVRTSNAEPGSNTAFHGINFLGVLPCGLLTTGSQCSTGIFFVRKLALASPRSRGGVCCPVLAPEAPPGTCWVLGRGGGEAGRALGCRQWGEAGIASRTLRWERGSGW